jgi:hypothetical protein
MSDSRKKHPELWDVWQSLPTADQSDFDNDFEAFVDDWEDTYADAHWHGDEETGYGA